MSRHHIFRSSPCSHFTSKKQPPVNVIGLRERSQAWHVLILGLEDTTWHLRSCHLMRPPRGSPSPHLLWAVHVSRTHRGCPGVSPRGPAVTCEWCLPATGKES